MKRQRIEARCSRDPFDFADDRPADASPGHCRSDGARAEFGGTHDERADADDFTATLGYEPESLSRFARKCSMRSSVICGAQASITAGG